MLLIGISINQLKSMPESTTALGLTVTTGAYVYTLIFVSYSGHLLVIISVSCMDVLNKLILVPFIFAFPNFS